MKKRLFVALCAIASVASIHAYKIKINNRTGKQGMPVRVELFTSSMESQEPYVSLVRTITLNSGKEASVKLKARKPGSTITGVQALALHGAVRGKRAAFIIPQHRLNKDIKLTLSIKDGQLEIGQKK